MSPPCVPSDPHLVLNNILLLVQHISSLLWQHVQYLYWDGLVHVFVLHCVNYFGLNSLFTLHFVSTPKIRAVHFLTIYYPHMFTKTTMMSGFSSAFFPSLIPEKSLRLTGALLTIFINSLKILDVPISNF